jgi:hypothetical protein
MRQTRTLSRSAALRLWMERAAPVAAVCLLMVGGGLLLTQYSRIERRSCLALYAQARTAADTAAVDARWANAKARISCGRLRRDGLLDGGAQRVANEP